MLLQEISYSIGNNYNRHFGDVPSKEKFKKRSYLEW